MTPGIVDIGRREAELTARSQHCAIARNSDHVMVSDLLGGCAVQRVKTTQRLPRGQVSSAPR
jgi:hypothetical protein